MWNKVKKFELLLPVLFFCFVTIPSRWERQSLREETARRSQESIQYERISRQLQGSAAPRNATSLSLVSTVEEAARQLGIRDRIAALRPVAGIVELELKSVTWKEAFVLLSVVEETPAGGNVTFLKMTPLDDKAEKLSVQARLGGS